MAFHLYSRGKASGTYLSLAPIFPTNLPPDIRWGFDAIWNISIITTDSGVFEYTIDGGSTWFPLITTTANVEVICNVKADDKDSFNLRTTGGTDVFRIIVSIAPEDMQVRAGSQAGFPIPLPVDICPVNCVIDVDIQNQPIEVTWPSALPVDICPVTCDLPVINGSVSPLQVSVANPPGTPVGKTIVNLTNTAITANTDIFVALSPTGTVAGDSVIFRILWSNDEGSILSMTLNNSDFVDFNDSNAVKKNSVHLFDVVVDHADSFTLRYNKTSNIIFLRVIQLV
ncbi:hypothetical protein LCGC14_0762060 [marine sediment metagenome]|uniref:Uncharacterized protein n=1 Tax=marine sediment metagenome TaxID=412755 RepID=A0A0F9SKT5_9ZZZZ